MPNKPEIPSPKPRGKGSDDSNLANAKESKVPQKSSVELKWEGPLPPPQVLARYDDVVQNGAERVFRQFEAEAELQREMNSASLKAQIRDLMVGKIFALIFAMGMIGAVFFAIDRSYPYLAGILGSSVLGSVVWAFVSVTGERKTEKSKQERNSTSNRKR
ncbi:MAG: DUF2335 domain-containing protein [Rhodomicrobium sp.]